MAIYLDCNATTPMEPEVLEIVLKYMRDEYGNAGSRTHEFGLRAKKAVERAREQVAAVVAAQPEEVIFTSGATESNNLAIFGLIEEGSRTGRRHIVSTAIEHKAVLEPLEVASRRYGFEVTLLPVTPGGFVQAEEVAAAVRSDTLLVSVMQVNNETGVLQPVADIADLMSGRSAFLHVDAAQGFGKSIEDLRHPRIDMISISGHKIYAPKGIGALVARRARCVQSSLQPLFYGGGQERGLRPGTLAVALIAGLGLSAEIASRDHIKRSRSCAEEKKRAIKEFQLLGAKLNGDQNRMLPSVLNISIPGIDSETAMVALKDIAAISNGSACTSSSYTPSHVLLAMGLAPDFVASALRISWSHLTPRTPWAEIATALRLFL